MFIEYTKSCLREEKREDLWQGQRGDNSKGECNGHLVRVRSKSKERGKLGWGREGSGQKQMRWSGLNGVAHLLHLSHIIFGTLKA